MQRSGTLFPILLAAVVLGAAPRAGVARSSRHPIALTYRGGPLLSNVKVVTLFWGADWSGNQLTGYFNNFFTTLFADGRYLGNLAEYGNSNYRIGNGTFAGTLTDSQQPPAKLQDAQIQAEIRAQIAAGHLPKPDQNTTYIVFTPPGVEVFDQYGDNSVRDFYSYHDYAFGVTSFPYILIAYDGAPDDPHNMTVFASHELAEVVTDPEVTGADNQVGWYDDYYGEIGDIVDTLYSNGLIGAANYTEALDGSDGSVYLVEKFWSVKKNAPVGLTE